MTQSSPRYDVYAHKESGKLLFVPERTEFPTDFNKAFWRLVILGTEAPPHVAKGLKNGPYYVTTPSAIEKLS